MHPSPDVLALLALGEEAGTQAELAHLAGVPGVPHRASQLSHAVEVGRRTSEDDVLQSPRPEVWEAVRAELGFGAQPARTGRGHSAPEPAAPAAGGWSRWPSPPCSR